MVYNSLINCGFFSGEDGEGKEKQVEEKKEEEDEIDPLDAYMQEVQQVSSAWLSMSAWRESGIFSTNCGRTQ